jgi:ATP-binding cassette subfamily B protein
VNLEQLAWPTERLGEAIAALAHSNGWVDVTQDIPTTLRFSGDEQDFDLSGVVAHLGLEAEAVETDYAGVRGLLERCAPAVLQLPGKRFLPVLRRCGKQLYILDTKLQQRPVILETVREEMCSVLRNELGGDIETLMAIADVSKRRYAKARAALLEELLAEQRIRAGWLVRPTSSAALTWQARDYRVRGLLATLFTTHALAFALWLGAWWLLGQGVFSGHLDTGWLQAWVLLLFTQIPLLLLASGAGSLFAIRAGAILKRRLLAGALRLNPEEIRHLGFGRLLGCTLEAEALEQMAVSGGFLGLTGLVDLILAGGILSLAPDLKPVLALGACSLVGVGFGANYLACQRRWTEKRLTLTDTLVEGMVGHRTRAIQEPRERWNSDEDGALAAYYKLCQKRDRAALHLRVTLPRGSFLAGIAALIPAFAASGEMIVPIALGIGGVLTAHLAFRQLGAGMEQALNAWVAFEQIRPFWQAGRRKTEDRKQKVAFEQIRPFWQAALRSQAPGDNSTSDFVTGAPVIDARNLTYRHAGRSEHVLCGVNLRIGATDRVLLEGSSGSGKSTLAAILAGQRQAEAGLCLTSGLDRASLGNRGWRQRIALVPQFHENHIFMGTLAFNLLLGRNWPPSSLELDEAESLCKALGLESLLERMPGGLFQIVGETGWQLSHGERERIYIARALLQNAKVIILDESVSSLDPQTLHQTMELLWEQAPAMIVIVHA